MESKRKGLSRREVIVGGVTAAALGGCLAPADYIDDDLEPVAHWQEDDEMTAIPSKNTQPLVLWGSIVAQPNVDAPVPNEQLMNPYQLPMEILEIRVRVYPLITTASSFQGLTGMGVGMKMDLGRASLVDAGVPISLFGTVRDSYESEQPVMCDPAVSTTYSYPTAYAWRLKYPLFVPAGATPAITFMVTGQNAFPVNIDVIYIGRSWDATRIAPRKVMVPWVASYQSKSFDYVSQAAAAFDTSPTLDILNPFGVPLELQRLTGRIGFISNAISSSAYAIVEDLEEFRIRLSELRLRSSRGFDLIRTPVPFNAAFPGNWRAWDIPNKWYIAPREYYRAQLKVNPVTETILQPSTRVGRAQFAIGIVGYREVAVSSLAEGSK